MRPAGCWSTPSSKRPGRRAIRLAFRPSRDLAGLAAWKTPRIIAKTQVGNAGGFAIQSHDRLSRLRMTVAKAAAGASSRLVPVDAEAPEAESFRVVANSPEANASESADATTDASVTDFFSGLAVGPDARRELPPIKTEFDERAMRLAERDRNFRACLKQQTKSPTHGAELLAMVRSSTEGADRATATLQVATLADAFRRKFQWELAEAAYVEMVDQHSDEPASLDAMRWLLQYWTGAELTYQRLRLGTPTKDHLEFAHAPVEQAIQKALDLAVTDPAQRDPTDRVDQADSSRLVTQTGHLRVNGTQDWLDVELKNQSREHGAPHGPA